MITLYYGELSLQIMFLSYSGTSGQAFLPGKVHERNSAIQSGARWSIVGERVGLRTQSAIFFSRDIWILKIAQCREVYVIHCTLWSVDSHLCDAIMGLNWGKS